MIKFIKHKLSNFKDWALRWVRDEDGDIGLQVFGFITFVKYKYSTIIVLGERDTFHPADKFV